MSANVGESPLATESSAKRGEREREDREVS